MYTNYSRDDSNDDLCIYDPRAVYGLETQDLPYQCPLRQEYYNQLFSRSPQQPPSAPPNFTPTEPQAQQFGAEAFVEQGAIKHCTFRFIYIWPRRGSGFWAFLTFVGRRSVSGFRWTGRTWRYFGMDLRDIRSFQCF